MAVDDPIDRTALDRTGLRLLGDRARPHTLAGERVLPVAPCLAQVIPGGLQRGTLVAVTGQTAVSLALALVAAPSAVGSWSAAIGVPSLGLLAAAELGVSLERMVLVQRPEQTVWSTVVAALLDAFDVVLVHPEQRVAPADQRRLLARARERGAVLVQAGGRPDAWPDAPDLRATVVAQAWQGLGVGHGHLQARRVTVEITGRRCAGRPRRADLWLPGPDGRPSPLVTSSTDLPVAPAGTFTGPSLPTVSGAPPLREVG